MNLLGLNECCGANFDELKPSGLAIRIVTTITLEPLQKRGYEVTELIGNGVKSITWALQLTTVCSIMHRALFIIHLSNLCFNSFISFYRFSWKQHWCFIFIFLIGCPKAKLKFPFFKHFHEKKQGRCKKYEYPKHKQR
jgi:hypothetical protein